MSADRPSITIKNYLLRTFARYLDDKGIPYTVSTNEVPPTYLEFRYKDLNYMAITEDGDTNYLRVMLPNVYKINDDLDKIYPVIDKLNSNYRVVKAYKMPNHDNLWISAEQFVFSYENTSSLYTQLVDILEIYYRELAVELKKLYSNDSKSE